MSIRNAGGCRLMGRTLSAATRNKWWSEDILNAADFAAGQSPITGGKPGRNAVLTALFHLARDLLKSGKKCAILKVYF